MGSDCLPRIAAGNFRSRVSVSQSGTRTSLLAGSGIW